MKWLSVILPILIGSASAKWVEFPVWLDMNQGLIAFLGFLSAALVGVIPVTANFLQSDRLTPIEAERLCRQLEAQQRYWLGLLAATVFALVIVVVVSALKERTGFNLSSGRHVDVGPALSFIVASSSSFVLLKMLAIFPGVMSLQHLRAELVMNAAKRAAAEQAEEIQRQATLPARVVPDDYGQIINPH